VKETWLYRKLATDGPSRGIEDSSEVQTNDATEMLRTMEQYLGRAKP
jgi:hypothetical protein